MQTHIPRRDENPGIKQHASRGVPNNNQTASKTTRGGQIGLNPHFPFPFFRTERMGDKQLGRQATNASADRTPPAPSTTAQKENPRARGRPSRTADVREQRYFSHVKKVRRSVTVIVTVTVPESTDPFPPSYPIPYFIPCVFLLTSLRRLPTRSARPGGPTDSPCRGASRRWSPPSTPARGAGRTRSRRS